MKIAVTGAGGFVGKRFMVYNQSRFELVPVSLREQSPTAVNLQGVTTLVHLAGKAHEMGTISDQVYFDINYELTRQLADRARQQGVRQFVYISSVKVYGDHIHGVLNEQSPCIPTDAYGASKLKAEQYLQSINDPAFTIAIVRPPLVYGPEVKGNTIRLLQLADKNWPLPLGRCGNARSMVFVDNLIELINTIITRQAAGVFVAGDSAPLSTDELIMQMRKYLGNSKGLVSIPGIVRTVMKKLKPALYTRLFGSFVVSNQATNRQLDFFPPYTTAQGIEQMVHWYKNDLK